MSTAPKAEWVDCPVCDNEADESPDCSRCLGIGSVCSACGKAYGDCRCEHAPAEYRHVPVWCPTCDQVDCPHAAAPVTPEGELAKAKAEIVRLTLLNEDKYRFLQGYCRAADSDRALITKLYAENARLRHRLETLELQKEL